MWDYLWDYRGGNHSGVQPLPAEEGNTKTVDSSGAGAW